MSNFLIQTKNVSTSAAYAALALRINGRWATENKTVSLISLQDTKINSSFIADPKQLAQWFVANWWRLRWETEKDNLSKKAQHDWDMSHKMSAAGGGFTWPNITFSTDNETMRCTIKPTVADQALIYFLQNETQSLSVTDFEAGLDEFLHQVTAKLSNDDPVKQLWQAVQEERNSPQASVWRKFEAKAGFDPDEAPENLIKTFIELGAEFGEASIAELVDEKLIEPHTTIPDLVAALKKSTYSIQPAQEKDITRLIAESKLEVEPWETGYLIARKLRSILGRELEPINNAELCDYLSVSGKVMSSVAVNPYAPSAGLKYNDTIQIGLTGGNFTSRRFNLTRLLADSFYTQDQPQEKLLAATTSRTGRQKFQRAFSQEFLCPSESLFSWMDTTSPSDELCEQAAKHFMVSPMLVKYAVENHAS